MLNLNDAKNGLDPFFVAQDLKKLSQRTRHREAGIFQDAMINRLRNSYEYLECQFVSTIEGAYDNLHELAHLVGTGTVSEYEKWTNVGEITVSSCHTAIEQLQSKIEQRGVVVNKQIHNQKM